MTKGEKWDAALPFVSGFAVFAVLSPFIGYGIPIAAGLLTLVIVVYAKRDRDYYH